MSYTNNINHFKSSILSGILIGLSTVTYLLSENKVVGAFMFSLGLLTICSYNLKLCTGMSGYLINQEINPIHFLITTVGNIIGVSILYILSTTWKPELIKICNNILSSKLEMNICGTFISGMLCGVFMFIAVDRYKHGDLIVRYLSIFLCVTCFVMNGFDHCVVSAYYLNSANNIKQLIDGMTFFLTAMLGNYFGAISINILSHVDMISGGTYDSD